MTPEELTPEKAAEIQTWLATTDLKFAELRGEMEMAELLCRKVRSRMFLAADGNNEERKHEAEIADETQAADDAYIAAKVEYEKLKARRERGEKWWTMWQSLESTRRRVL
jgi:uncharacterized protein YdeI (YjbR/CyaY-like superfamily)